MTADSPGRGRAYAALALVVLLVLGLLAAAYLAYRSAHLTETPLNPLAAGTKVQPDDERAQAKAVAEQFCLRMDQINGDDPDGYVKKVSALLTTKRRTQFQEEWKQFQQLGQQKGVKGTGTILASGIGDIDDDSASVLVAHDSTVTAPQGTTQRHFRWTVELRRIGGRWLVDDFNAAS